MEETSIKLKGNFLKSSYGVALKNSLYLALEINHKLPKHILEMSGMSGRKYRALINNLIESISNARYIEVGSWAGSSACSAMWGNAVNIVCIDNWSQFGGPKADFLINIDKSKNENVFLTLIEEDFRKVNWSNLPKANIYFFDGPHKAIDQYDGIVLAQPALDDLYILIVDDFNWTDVRNGTLVAINQLNLEVECSIEIKTTQDNSHPKINVNETSDWHNGYFIAVVRKK
jgi:hypothetical protein